MAEKNEVPIATLEYEHTGFEQALLKHKSKLILVGVLAVGGTLGYWGWKIYKEAAHTSAAVAFTRANTVEELKKVASEHSGQAGAGNALILAAERLSTDKPAEAVATLRDFLSQNATHPLRDLASWRLAEYTAAAGDAAAAEKEYQSVAQAGTAFSGFAWLRLGDMKWAAGDTEKAGELYDKILTNPSMSGNPAWTVAKDRKDRALKIKAPTLVDYKEPAPPASEPAAFNPIGDNLLPPPKLAGGAAPAPVPPIEIKPQIPEIIPAPAPGPDGATPPVPPAPAPGEAPADAPKNDAKDKKDAAKDKKKPK